MPRVRSAVTYLKDEVPGCPWLVCNNQVIDLRRRDRLEVNRESPVLDVLFMSAGDE